MLKEFESLAQLDKDTLFLDLYAGVGLFGFALADKVKEVILVEQSATSVRLAHYNKAYHKLDKVFIQERSVDHKFLRGLVHFPGKRVAIIDPPRCGLMPEVSQQLQKTDTLDQLFYLSCNPKTLVRDLKVILEGSWQIESVTGLDFFPKTSHLETLVQLRPQGDS